MTPGRPRVAVEMIHAYSLVHDDLPAMDDDDLRRGLPTCHKKFGEAMAILVGDALQTLAFETLAEGYPAPTAAACCLELARAAGACGMVGGQVDDLAWEGRERMLGRSEAERTVTELEGLHGRKTGALFRASLKMGALAAHANQESPSRDLIERLDAYGRCLGLAFQITDDLLDVEGDADQTGQARAEGRRTRQADLSRLSGHRRKPPPRRTALPGSAAGPGSPRYSFQPVAGAGFVRPGTQKLNTWSAQEFALFRRIRT